MNNKTPGFITTSGIIAGILTIIVVAVLGITSKGLLFSPGPLNAQAGSALGGVTAHADLINKCSNCHPAFWEKATMSDRCEVCHTNITAQKKDPTTMHGNRFKDNADLPCQSCHVDHKGATAALTDLRTAQISHQSTGFSIVAHQVRSDGTAFSCRDCHKAGYGAVKYDQAVCVTCHQQIKASFMQTHLQTFGNNCLACHDGKDSYGHTFDHQNVAFKLTGKHAPVTCEKCHQKAGSMADLRATPKDCVACHKKDNPHSGLLGSNCASCHKSEGWSPATIDHNVTSFKLVDKHASVACESCHVKKVYKGTPSDCTSCHQKDDKHKGQYGTDCALCHNVKGWPTTVDHNKFTFKLVGKHVTATCVSCHVNAEFKTTPADCASCHAKANPHSSRLGTACGNCHTASGWLPATFDHSLAAFQLAGKHVGVACESCHINKVYQGTATDCYSCHKKDDKHNGKYGTNCALCHTVNGWPTTLDHNKFAFKLTGKHVTTACESCHINGVFKGTPSDCASCHGKINPHSSLLGTNCGNCHTTGGWSPATFDHNLAAFKLTGAHMQAACASCHVNNVYRGTPSNCYACHAKNDKHNGQLGTNCSNCHTTTAWLPSTFDHNSTSFKLTGAHVQAACAGCHPNGNYKGTPTSCYACHAKNDTHKGQLGTNCSSCHTTSAWKPSTFNHNSAAFKLTGAHVQAACASCHPNGNYKGTPTNCYACHAKNDHHNGQFGTDCALCHSTKAWLPSTFDHNSSSFKLTGKHATAPCSGCHINGVYKGTPTACNACHSKDDAHSGQFGTGCGTCHSTSGWLPATFDHNLSNFKLTGKHASVPCASCHKNGVYKGTPTNCYACHAGDDHHNGAYGTSCGTCHSTGGWLPANFNHSGFPLTNGHAGLSCNSCHSSGKYQGLSTACSSCHAAPSSHSAYSGSCTQCHTTSNWNFNHPNKCDGSCTNHHKATCATCHPNGYNTYTCKKCHDSNTPGLSALAILIRNTKERQFKYWSFIMR